MRIWAIDPGTKESAFVRTGADGTIREAAKVDNDKLLSLVRGFRGNSGELLAVEVVASYGMTVGAEVFETCEFIGRLIEAWAVHGGEYCRVFRREVKLHLCGVTNAKDSNIRQALVDLYGGKDRAIGKKAAPGPLYGIKSDIWSALAIAVTVRARPRA